MAIYKMVGDKERLELIQETSFNHETVREVEDLQRLILDNPDVLEPGLFIIRAEFSEWMDSKRRIDLLALDEAGRLVVVELKRGQTGEHSELQAIRYAAMVANLTLDKIIETYQTYYGGTDEETRSSILAHLGASEEEYVELDTAKPRIILACEGFSKELTTTVLWLNGCDLEIKCVRLKPYRIDGEILVETSQIIPLPEAAEFIEQFQERERATRRQKNEGSQRVLGHGEFRESIDRANEEFRLGLNCLLDSAIGLEKEGIVELSTFTNRQGHYIRLGLIDK